VYEVPQVIEQHKLDIVILKKLGLEQRKRDDGEWSDFVAKIKSEKETLTIALVGKYTTMLDTYASLVEALKAASWHNNLDLVMRWIDAEELEKGEASEMLAGIAGIVVPGGFGIRGTEGKIKAIQFAREKQIPYLGLCLGMQLAVVEFARNVVGIDQATSQEFIDEGDESEERLRGCVIHIMEDQKTIQDKGGTMRLGGWDCVLDKDSVSRAAYGSDKIRERHRHRYEFNNSFKDKLTREGLRIAGTTPDGKLVEIVEVVDHPWFVGVQFHPEFTSRPLTGHPLFNAFIAAANDYGKQE
jgi:CTP synthase